MAEIMEKCTHLVQIKNDYEEGDSGGYYRVVVFFSNPFRGEKGAYMYVMGTKFVRLVNYQNKIHLVNGPNY